MDFSDPKEFQNKLNTVLDYNPETGVFVWKVNRQGGSKAGDIAGLTEMPNGKPSTVHITVFCKRYVAHDLAFVIMTGRFPRMRVRHIDKCSQNNAWENLSDVPYVPSHKEVTPELLRGILDYDSKKGLFRWKQKGSNHCKDGWFRGSPDRNGRLQIHVQGKSMKAHTIAWMIFHGVKPTFEIAHDDGDHTNNRIKNLSDITHAENMKNIKKSSANKSGVTGVSWVKDKNRFCARIRVNYRTIHLGYFGTVKEAEVVRKEAERRLGFHPRHGETR